MTVKAPAVGTTASRTIVTDLPRSILVQYAGASGDYNPIHTDELYARETLGLPSVMAHGMLTMGLTGTVVADWADAQSARLTTFGGRFLQPVWPGDDLVVTLTVTHIDPIPDGQASHVELTIDTRNQLGDTVFRGYAAIDVPAR